MNTLLLLLAVGTLVAALAGIELLTKNRRRDLMEQFCAVECRKSLS